MKQYIILSLLLLCNSLSFAQVDWPFPNENQQANVIGSMGEYRYSSSSNSHRFHKGVDLTNGNEYSIHAINSGNVEFVNGGGTWNAWTSYIRIGTVSYRHMKPKSSIINRTVTQVQVGDYLGEILTTNGIPPHLHLDENNTNYLHNNLSPYIDNSDPFFETNIIDNGVQFYQNGLLKSTTNHSDIELDDQTVISGSSYTKLYNKVDIVAHAIDYRTGSNGNGAGGQMVPYEISWQLLNNDNEQVLNNRLRFDAVPNNDAAIASFHPQSVHAGNPSIHIITSHPTVLPHDRYLNTNLRVNESESWPNNTTLDARCILESQTPDGLYTMNLNAYDVDYADNPNNSADQKTVNLLIDNYKPFIEKVVVYMGNTENGDVVYEGGWKWNGSDLTFSTSEPENIAYDNAYLDVRIYTSEPMGNVEMSYPGKTQQDMTVLENSNNMIWDSYIKNDLLIAGDFILTFNSDSKDLTGNSLMGFSSTRNVSAAQIPKRQINGSWSPSNSGSDDVIHKFTVIPRDVIPPKVRAGGTEYSNDYLTIRVENEDDHASHYKLYKNTVNSISTAQEITGWNHFSTPVRTFEDHDTRPGINYYYWAKAKSFLNVSPFSRSSIGKIYSPCSATFTYNQQNYNDGAYVIDFESNINGDIISYEWDFGDGYSSTEADPTHYYNSSGSYIVSLRVVNSDGVDYTYTDDNVKVLGSAGGDIDVYLSSSTGACYIGTPIVFYGGVINDAGVGPYTYSFDLGDGRVKKIVDDWKSVFTENIEFNSVGEHIISLTVTSSDGLTGFSAQERIRVYDDDIPDMMSFDEWKIKAEPCSVIPMGGTISMYNLTTPPEYVGHNMWWWDFGNDGGATGFSSYVPVVTHTYMTKGHKTIYVTIDYSNGNDCLDCNIWSGIDVVDCSNAVTNDFSIATYNDFNEIHRYWSGDFDLTGLSSIPNYNTEKIELSSCNDITLRPGFSSSPTSGNYLLLKANETCIKGGNITTKSTENFEEQETLPKDVDNNRDILIYPNPSHGNFIIEFSNVEDIKEFGIFNMLGQRIYYSEPLNSIEQIDLVYYNEGLYIVKFNFFNGTSKIRKLILDK